MRDFFDTPVLAFSLATGVFSTPLSPSCEEGVLTPVPKPYAPTIGARDVTAPTRRSEPLSSKVGGASKPSPNFLRNKVAIVLRLIGDFLCGVTPH